MLFHWALLPLLWIRGVLPGGSARWRFDFRWTSDEVGAFLRACRTVQHCSTSQSFSIFAFNLGTEAATRGRCTPFPWTIYHWTLLRNEAARVYFEQQKAGRKVQASRLVLRLREDGADNESEPVTPILDDHMDHDNIVPLIINNLSCVPLVLHLRFIDHRLAHSHAQGGVALRRYNSQATATELQRIDYHVSHIQHRFFPDCI